MYRKNSSGWSKHIDFILLDLFCVQLAFYISYVMRQGDWNPYVIPIFYAVTCVQFIPYYNAGWK